jgi:formylglycine-generating enzyme
MTNVLQAVGDEFEPLGADAGDGLSFVHKASGVIFRFVPGGSYLMGLSQGEERAAIAISSVLQANLQEMRPVKRYEVGPMLVSTTPVLNNYASPSGGEYRNHPAYFRRGEAEKIATALNCRLPFEFEREYFCRAGTQTLFPFGDQLPADEELEKWLSSDFSSLDRLRCNGFGLYGVFNPEWCQEKFAVSLEEGAELLDGSYAIRGGGAYFWPWQDQEWVWCMSAMRSPSSGLEDGEACVRLVRSFTLPHVPT